MPLAALSAVSRLNDDVRCLGLAQVRKELSAQTRSNISATMKAQLKGGLSEEHRAKIASSMKRLMSQNSEHRARISASSLGKLKLCSLCGEAGHNRRKCPTITGRPAEVRPEAAGKLLIFVPERLHLCFKYLA